MITCLDIIVPGRSRKHTQNNNNNNVGISVKALIEKEEPQLVEEEPQLVEEQSQPVVEEPIIDSHASELSATGVAGLAVVLLLGAALAAMRTLNKKQPVI